MKSLYHVAEAAASMDDGEALAADPRTHSSEAAASGRAVWTATMSW